MGHVKLIGYIRRVMFHVGRDLLRHNCARKRMKRASIDSPSFDIQWVHNKMIAKSLKIDYSETK